MGKKHPDSKSSEFKSKLPGKKLHKVEITSKKIKHVKLLKMKIKHHKKDRSMEDNGQLITQNTSSHLKMKGAKMKFKKKQSKTERRRQACNEKALDEYFESIDIFDKHSDDGDTFGDSFCELSSVSFEPTTFDADSSLTHVQNYEVLKPAESAVNDDNVPDSLVRKGKSLKFHSLPTMFDADSSLTNVPNYEVVKPAESAVNDDNVPDSLTRKGNSFKFHSLPNNRYLISMAHPTSLYFQGQLNVKVVVGSLEVLGCMLKSDMPNSIEVYSPGGSSLLCLATARTCILIDISSIENTLIGLGMDPEIAENICSKMNRNDCLVTVEKANSHLTSYLGSQCSIYLYPRIALKTRPFFKEENALHCQFYKETKIMPKVYKKLPEWDELADSIIDEAGNCSGSTRIMICGGKAVGKSTLLRFLINKSLSRFNDVLCLDFDPGQSEFTVPGCVSVVRVRDPLLGPNFTHLLRPERMVYVGDADISKCPQRYLKCAQYVFDYCKTQQEFENMPWFINTMGFSKGLGVDLTTALIHMIQPSRLVQIESRSTKRNFPEHLTPNFARNSESQWCQELMAKSTEPNYSHHVLQSAAEKKVKGVEADWGMQPKVARDVMVLSYFSQMLKPPRFSLTDILPVKKAFARISLSVCHETLSYGQYLSVMNANLVGLCAADERNILRPSDPAMPTILPTAPIAPCLGFGIVRGIDMEAHTLYLITPLSLEELKAVNCLLLGAIMLPACVYTKPSSGLGHIPYVTKGPGQATSKGIARRFFQPLK